MSGYSISRKIRKKGNKGLCCYVRDISNETGKLVVKAFWWVVSGILCWGYATGHLTKRRWGFLKTASRRLLLVCPHLCVGFKPCSHFLEESKVQDIQEDTTLHIGCFPAQILEGVKQCSGVHDLLFTDDFRIWRKAGKIHNRVRTLAFRKANSNLFRHFLCPNFNLLGRIPSGNYHEGKKSISEMFVFQRNLPESSEMNPPPFVQEDEILAEELFG